jgi:hypothetical protein
MAAPFVGDFVSVATDRNEISLRNPSTRRPSLLSRRCGPLIVFIEVLAEVSGVEP